MNKLARVLGFAVISIALIGCGNAGNAGNNKVENKTAEVSVSKEKEESKQEEKKSFFKENRLIQTPDSAVDGISFVEEEDGYYTYSLGSSENEADVLVRSWMAYLMSEGYSVSDANGNGTTFYVKKDGSVELIYAVGQLDYGYVMMISFN